MKIADITLRTRPVGIRLLISGLCYVVINSLFILKYTARTEVSPLLAAGIYVLLLSASLPAVYYLVKKPATVKIAWYLMSVVITMAVLIGLVIKIDPYGLSVDRWSALHNTAAGLLDGQHPFTVETHMGQQASPFPVMYLIAAPFFLLGDVGYLQCGCFLCTTLTVAKLSGIDTALWLNVLLMLSPAFWYEGAVRSDLFSNFLLVALVIYIAIKVRRVSFRKNCLIAFVTGLLFCTRGVTALPLIIFYGYYLKGIPVKQGVTMIVISGVASILPFIPLAIWDWDIFIALNPALVQSEKTPPIVQVLTLAITLFAAYKVKSGQDIFLYGFLILFSLMTVSFIVMVAGFGYSAAFKGSLFDITYFSLALPFFVFGVVMHTRIAESATDAGPASIG